MAVYRCRFCGSIYDEEKEGVPVSDLKVCPVCMVTADKLVRTEDGEGGGKTPDREKEEPVKKAGTRETCEDCVGRAEETLAYDPEYARTQTDARYMDEIHEMAVKGQSIIAAMGTQMPMPMVLNHAVYVSHMSFGALSRETKTALSRGSAMARTAMCSGEGGILPEEKAAAYKYIFEYVPNQYSVTGENLREADAIEIKIGQGTKPGMGGHLPGGKVTPEIAAIRNKPLGQDVISPSRFTGIDTKEDLKALVDRLRFVSGGRPIGIKIAAGRIEKDLEFCVYAGPDFITIDGRGGATGASPKIIRDSTSVPTIYALYRARKYLDQTGCGAQLVITGGLRVSSDFAKALAMGADAVAIASAALMAAACQQYRICGTGMCPVGVATQDEKLRGRFKEDAAAQRVANFLRVSLEEIKTFARITGHDNIHDMNADDLCTVSREISEFTNIRHA